MHAVHYGIFMKINNKEKKQQKGNTTFPWNDDVKILGTFTIMNLVTIDYENEKVINHSFLKTLEDWRNIGPVFLNPDGKLNIFYCSV